MKFELVEPPEWAEENPSEHPFEPKADTRATEAHAARAERMRNRAGELGTRLTGIIEAVRPAMARLEASIVRAEREVTGTGHGPSAEPPAGFRVDRFRAPGREERIR